MFHVIFVIVFSVPSSLVGTCWERADILALLCVMFFFVPFPHGVPGHEWYLIVSIPNLCLLLYFVKNFLAFLQQV